ncbi:MAG: hypothetical protein GX335_10590 [Firmicutes bacterium]|nr:hypothetical protein [Bacillota bacterium]
MTRGDVFILGLILGMVSLYFGHTLGQRWLRKRRLAGAKRSEEEAAKLLEQQGFRIICRQPAATSRVYVDGKERTTTIRADFIIKRGWRKYVVEVKSGRTAPRLNARTRRQLLEYQLAFRAHSILLVDMRTRTWREVAFRWPLPWGALFSTFTVAAILGGAIVYVFGRGIR